MRLQRLPCLRDYHNREPLVHDAAATREAGADRASGRADGGNGKTAEVVRVTSDERVNAMGMYMHIFGPGIAGPAVNAVSTVMIHLPDNSQDWVADINAAIIEHARKYPVHGVTVYRVRLKNGEWEPYEVTCNLHPKFEVAKQGD